jgi:hypothetical protein
MIAASTLIKPRIIQSLIYKLVGNPKAHDTIVKFRRELMKVFIDLRGTDCEFFTLKAILLYDEILGKGPDSLDNVLDFVSHSCEEMFGYKEEVRGEIEILKTETDPFADKDINVIVLNCISKTRKYWFLDALDQCMGLVLNGPQPGQDKKLTGVDGAKRELYRRLGSDSIISNPILGGIWQDNTANIEQKLTDYLHKKKKNRIKMGFGAIDKKFVIRHGKTVVIAGAPGDGKTSFLTSAVYNMSRAGENILYITMESTPDEMWENLAFVHISEFYKNRFYLPSKSDWDQHDPDDNPTITTKDFQRMIAVVEDIKNRTSCKGLIDVQCFFTMEEIIAYFEANDPQNHYSAVVIDYLGKLNVTVDKYQQEEKQRESMIRQAVNWCSQTGTFALFSPSQINREANKSAKKNSKEDAPGKYDLNAVFKSSVLQQDVGLFISIFSPDELRMENQMQVTCLKYRDTERFEDHKLTIDPRTKYVYDFYDRKEAMIPADVENTKSIGEVKNLSPEELDRLLNVTEEII